MKRPLLILVLTKSANFQEPTRTEVDGSRWKAWAVTRLSRLGYADTRKNVDEATSPRFFFCSNLIKIKSLTQNGMKASKFILLFMLFLVSKVGAEKVNNLYYRLNSDNNTATVTRPAYAQIGDLVIPESILYDNVVYSVVGIGEEAFRKYEGLTGITIPNTVISIENGAFWDCGKLKYVKLPSSLKEIGPRAFGWCKSLKDIVLPNSIKEIKSNTFFNCKTLSSIVLGDSISYIGESAFMWCDSLKTIILPHSVEKIDSASIYSCRELNTVIIGRSIKKIGPMNFSSIPKLTDIYCFADQVPSAIQKYPKTTKYSFEKRDVQKATLHVPASLINEYKNTVPWNYFGDIVALPTIPHTITYKIDGEKYKSYEYNEFEIIPIEGAPYKEGFSFMGWNNAPRTMPNNDIVVEGYYSANIYKVTYSVDGKEYKTFDVAYNSTIPTENAPEKEGYSFSGWSEIPETMPAKDVNITGSFIINKYTLKYVIDGEEYKTYSIEYGASVNPENRPEKEGYTFSGWSEIPQTMPSHDVTVTGSFNINQYTITYMIDGEVYKTVKYEYGAAIVPEPDPTKEGCKFSGWSEIPEVMPAHNVTVNGAFIDGRHSITYMVDGQVYKTERFEVGATVAPEPAPTKEGYTFSGWSEIPEVMPDQDVTVTGTFVPNKYKVTYMFDGEVYQTVEYEYGKKVTPVSRPEGNYETFVWEGLPSTMPAHDVVVTANYTEAKSHKMVLSFKSGDKVTFVLSDKPVLTFAGDKLVVKSSTGTIEYLRSDVDDFHFDEIETSVEAIEYAGDDNVTVYDMNGRIVAKLGNESFESAKTYLNAFKQGMYIIKIGNKQRIKYLKK